MANGESRKSICEKVGNKFKISPRTVETQYYQLISELNKIAKENRTELKASLMARNDFLYKQSLAEGKLKTALDINMAQAKLGGLFEAQETEQVTPKVITITEKDCSKDLRVVGDDE